MMRLPSLNLFQRASFALTLPAVIAVLLRLSTVAGVAAEPAVAYLGTWTHEMPWIDGKSRTILLQCERGPNGTVSWRFVQQFWSYKAVFTHQVSGNEEIELHFKMVGHSDERVVAPYTLTYRLKPKDGGLTGQLWESWRPSPMTVVLTKGSANTSNAPPVPPNDADLLPLKGALLSHEWLWTDSMDGKAVKIRFNADGTFYDRFRWHYWVIGRQSVHVEVDSAVLRDQPSFVLAFDPSLTRFNTRFGAKVDHQITGLRLGPLGNAATALASTTTRPMTPTPAPEGNDPLIGRWRINNATITVIFTDGRATNGAPGRPEFNGRWETDGSAYRINWNDGLYKERVMIRSGDELWIQRKDGWHKLGKRL